VEDKALRAGLYNLSLHNSREDIIRAFLEGIALNTRWLMQPVTKFLNSNVKQINIVGGGAQSDVWCQIFADVMGVCIRQVDEPVYANARGAAWIAAAGLKQISFTDIRRLVKVKKAYSPEPVNQAVYLQRYEQFLDVYKAIKPVYHKMNE
jgi:xylulokinase